MYNKKDFNSFTARNYLLYARVREYVMCVFVINKLSIYRKRAGAPLCSIYTHTYTKNLKIAEESTH